MQITAAIAHALPASFKTPAHIKGLQVSDPAERRQLKLVEEQPVGQRDLEVMRERHQILYQMLLDLTEEIDALRERVNMLCCLWREKN